MSWLGRKCPLLLPRRPPKVTKGVHLIGGGRLWPDVRDRRDRDPGAAPDRSRFQLTWNGGIKTGFGFA